MGRDLRARWRPSAQILEQLHLTIVIRVLLNSSFGPHLSSPPCFGVPPPTVSIVRVPPHGGEPRSGRWTRLWS